MAEPRLRYGRIGSPAGVVLEDEDGADALTIGREGALGGLLDAGGRELNIRPYVVGDGVADDTDGFKAAVAAAKAIGIRLVGPANLTIRLTSAVDMSGLLHVQMESKLLCDWVAAAGASVTAGSNAASLTPCRLYFREVTSADGSTPVQPLLRFVGLKRGHTTVDSSPYVQLYANAGNAMQASIGYSSFWWGKIDKLELLGEAGAAWINENNHYGGRFRNITLGGTYSHNQNIFYKPCVEGVSTINLNSGTNNSFLELRSENGLLITCAPGTYHNIFIDRFVSNQDVITGGATFVDNGVENIYLSSVQQFMERVSVMSLTKDSRVYDLSSEYIGASAPSSTPTFAGMTGAGGNADQINVVVPVDVVKRWQISSDAALWRPYIYCLDANGALLNANDGSYIRSFGGWVPAAGGYYTFNADVSGGIIVFAPEVKYARFRIRCTAGGNYTYLVLEAFLQAGLRTNVLQRIAEAVKAPPFQTTKPLRGFARKGDTVVKSGGVWTCTAVTDTTMTAAAASGASVIAVSSGAAIVNGDPIAVERADGLTQWTTVTAGGGTNNLTLAAPLGAATAIGGRIHSPHWA